MPPGMVEHMVEHMVEQIASRMHLPLSRSEFLNLAGSMAALGVLLTLLFHWQPGPVAALASAVSDTYYRYNPHAPSRDIVFVAIDHKAVQRFGRWPWQRQHVAAGIEQAREAKVIALDMVFSEPTDPVQDKALGAALARATVVGGYLLNGVRNARPDADGMARLANSALTDTQDVQLIESEEVELSIPEVLAGQAALAPLNTLADKDERFRHYPVGFVLLGMVQPNLGVQTMQIFLDAQASLRGGAGVAFNSATLAYGDRIVHLDARGFTRLNYYPEASFHTISYADLFAPGFQPASLKDKVVLFGITEAGVADIRATPLGQYPGPLMHATFMANVLGGHGLYELGTAVMAAVILLALILTLAVTQIRQIVVRAALYIGLAAVAYLAALLLYRQAGIWLESAYLMAAVAVAAMLIETSLLSHSKKHTEQLRLAFSTYLPPGLVNRIVENPEQLKLGGEKKEITVLFSDIRGFTSMSEGVSPERLAEIMASYFQPMTEAVFDQGGTLDKYIGDAIMALFNAPLDLPDHVLAACRAAIAMQYAQIRINQTLVQGGAKALKTGIGINCGPAIVGNLGSSIRFNYTAIGDTVNLASRLESATKKLGVDIVIGESAYLRVKDRLPCRALGEIQVAGKEQAQPVYELCWKMVADPLTGKILEPESAGPAAVQPAAINPTEAENHA
ncbi:MAG: adenylate/guanylate cyclase domain-containing protein [Pseudomonadota bacterium]|nr:adenylate/guanylate cyclase domain-containing protein [Pseudomonadota bacterium]